MFDVKFDYDGSLEGLDEKIAIAVAAKLTYLTNVLHQKVIDNVSGKILQKQSGDLANSIQQTVTEEDKISTGVVFVDPATPKAWALERGGKGYYPIFPDKAQMLTFFWGKIGRRVSLPFVNHPPSEKYAYLEEALEEMRSIIPEEFSEAIQKAIAEGAS